MNKEMIENQVFDLLESKDFNALTEKEKLAVISIMTEEEYVLQRRIIQEANTFEENNLPAPLVIPSNRKVVPIWLASFSSAAAAAVLVFLLMKSERKSEITLLTSEPVVVRDTLIVENTVTDTVIDYRTVEVKSAAPMQDDVAMVNIPEKNSGRANVPPIRENDIENAGVSAANDATIETFRSRPFIGM